MRNFCARYAIGLYSKVRKVPLLPPWILSQHSYGTANSIDIDDVVCDENDFSGDFARGIPCVATLGRAAQLLSSAHSQMITKDLQHNLPPVEYGERIGNDEPRAAFSRFLSEQYGDTVEKSDIFISGGSSFSLFMLGQVVVPNCKFLIEEVIYYNAMHAIRRDLKREIVPVKCSLDGVDLQDLEEKLKLLHASCPSEQSYSCAFYVIPTFQNPRGICFSAENSLAIVKLAKRYNALVICDDVYNLLYFNAAEKPRRLRSYAIEAGCEDNVVSIGSFSKILSPGLRLGWIECSPKVLSLFDNLMTLESGCNFGHYQSYMISKAIEDGSLNEHLQFIRGRYQERANFIINNLPQHLPSGSTLTAIAGSFHTWVELPEGFNARRLKEIANKNHNVDFHLGEKFSAVGGHQNCFRLTVSQLPMPNLIRCYNNLASALKQYIAERND